jgi:hypothetical protein
MSDSNFTHQSVFIVGGDSLFDEGITHLLAQQTDLLVSRLKFFNERSFLIAVKQNLPDVILVCESESLDAAHILALLSSQTILTRLLLAVIVVIRLNNNVIDVYERPRIVAGKINFKPRRILVETENDLLNIVSRKYTLL